VGADEVAGEAGASDDDAASELDAAGCDVDALESGPEVTKLVTVTSSAALELPQAASKRASTPVTAIRALRRRATRMNPPLDIHHNARHQARARLLTVLSDTGRATTVKGCGAARFSPGRMTRTRPHRL